MNKQTIVNLKVNFFRILLMAALLIAASAIGYLFIYLGFPETNIVIVYLLAVLLTAWLTNGFAFGILASMIATISFNYLFTEPYFTLAVNDPSYIITFIIMIDNSAHNEYAHLSCQTKCAFSHGKRSRNKGDL